MGGQGKGGLTYLPRSSSAIHVRMRYKVLLIHLFDITCTYIHSILAPQPSDLTSPHLTVGNQINPVILSPFPFHFPFPLTPSPLPSKKKNTRPNDRVNTTSRI